MVYGQLFPKATDVEMESIRRLGARWKVRRALLISVIIVRKLAPQQYEKEGKWVYEQHPFWCTGYTFWELPSEAPDLFLHLSRSDLVYFKGDLNHRKLTYDCAAPASTPFDVAIGPMASTAGAPKVASLRTIKSDVVVGLGDDGDTIAEKLDDAEPGWKISGKYVGPAPWVRRLYTDAFARTSRLSCSSQRAVLEKKCASPSMCSPEGRTIPCLNKNHVTTHSPFPRLLLYGPCTRIRIRKTRIFDITRGSTRRCESWIIMRKMES
jgi:hypothetical protein